jgi:hypothetical protein
MTTIAGRFEVQAVAGEGGMGTVYRALDLMEDRATVAVKVVRGDFANERFEREAMLLAQIEGEGIVRYVSHGRIDADSMYLAMEWLEGEGLDARLARGPLTINESLLLGRRVARALGIAHGRGVVHRDVKPSNVILRDGLAAQATLVDFGIARAEGALRAMTATGAVIGTPQYMAPEQARGERALDARADVFSLGCLLFEVLSGRAAFVGAHIVAVLAKILLDPAGRVSALRADVPAVLDDLIASMLEKSPGARPADGVAVATALDVIHAGDAPALRTSWAPSIGATERRLATVIIARPAKEPPSDALAFAGTEEALHGVTGEMQMIELAASAGVSITALANGALVGAVVADAGASSAAERAVRCALAMQAELDGATVCLATGRAVVATELPVGEAIDIAAALLDKHAASPGIFLDEATASMVDARFVLEREGDGANGPPRISLIGERSAAERLRTVMGREVPCVGRTRELTLFEATFRECVEEPVARAFLVIAPPGIGKTRLRRELVAKIGAWESPPAVWLGLADPLMQGASYALAGDLLRRVLELPEGGSNERRRASLLARVAGGASKKKHDPSFVAAFLGEIVDVPFGDEDEALRAARRSPELMRARILEAVTAFIASELEEHPILLVVEDVHWADVASVRLLAGVLERLVEAPLMVFALARPSVDEVHPRLWEEQRASRFVLEPLLKKAAEKLARAVLGDHADIDAIVKRAEGNALFVEELARVCAQGGGASALPPTVAAAAEARLAALSSEARQVLRACAIFGERFWPGAVARLVGSPVATRIAQHLEALQHLEVVSEEATSRFTSEREYLFRHALVRDAAYAMLTDDDRVIGHALAAEWLEPRVDDHALLAHHYELGDRREDAARCHVIASEHALLASDAAGVARHLAGARSCGATGELLGRALLAHAELTLWGGQNLETATTAQTAMGLLAPGTERWFKAAGIAAAAFGKVEKLDATLLVADAIQRTPASDPASGCARAIARIRAATQLVYFGEIDRSDALVDGCEREPGVAGDMGVHAWLCDAAFDRAFGAGIPIHPSRFVGGRALYERLGDRRGAVSQAGHHVWMLAMLGALDEARAALEPFEREAQELGFRYARIIGASVRIMCATSKGMAALVDGLRTMRQSLTGRAGAGVGAWLAEVLFACGELDAARVEVESALPLASTSPACRGCVLSISSLIKLRTNDIAGALADSASAAEATKKVVVLANARSPCLARFEVLHATGQRDEARAVLAAGAKRLVDQAATLREYGPTYLEHGWRTAELLQLAREHGVDPR